MTLLVLASFIDPTMVSEICSKVPGLLARLALGRWRMEVGSCRVRAEMGPLRKSVSVRLEEGVHARLRRQSLRSGVPTSALVRALVHRWLDEQDEVGEATTGPPGPERERQPGLFSEEGEL